jgi:meiotically up-regulated gene 157 (Mug157) protein
MLSGVGAPAKRNGMSKSPFRPSDDACTLPFPVISLSIHFFFFFLICWFVCKQIGANAMAAVNLQRISILLQALKEGDRAAKAFQLSQEISSAIYSYGTTTLNG